MTRSRVFVNIFDELKSSRPVTPKRGADDNKQSDGSGIGFLAHKGNKVILVWR